MIKEKFFKILDKFGCCGRPKAERNSLFEEVKSIERKKKRKSSSSVRKLSKLKAPKSNVAEGFAVKEMASEGMKYLMNGIIINFISYSSRTKNNAIFKFDAPNTLHIQYLEKKKDKYFDILETEAFTFGQCSSCFLKLKDCSASSLLPWRCFSLYFRNHETLDFETTCDEDAFRVYMALHEKVYGKHAQSYSARGSYLWRRCQLRTIERAKLQEKPYGEFLKLAVLRIKKPHRYSNFN